MIANLFATTAMKISGGAIVALALALAFVMVRADGFSDKLANAKQDFANERAAHNVTIASVEILQTKLAAFVGAGRAGRVAQLASIEAQAKDNAGLQADVDAIRAEMANMGPQNPCDCSTPDSVLNAEGL
jgi:hypothetical protein